MTSDRAYHFEREEMATETITTICGFDEAWIGPCKQVGNPRCEKHSNKICASCGAAATKNCPETGQFVCGENLCNDCEHTIFPSGTNGGVGFNAESLPDGMNRHCKKTEQRFQSWYAREPEAQPAPDTSGEWRAQAMPTHGWRVVDATEREVVADVYREEDARQIVSDHNVVPLLVAALKEALVEAEVSTVLWQQSRGFVGTVEDAYDKGLMPPAFVRARDALAAVGREEKRDA